MSLLGFDKAIRGLADMEKKFLREGIALARKEFDYNFMTRSNSENGSMWEAVRRPNPPPILEVSGSLRSEAVRTGHVSYIGSKAILTVDPIDENGRGYAQYHQDGLGRNAERAYITQSSRLTSDQENLLMNLTDNLFK